MHSASSSEPAIDTDAAVSSNVALDTLRAQFATAAGAAPIERWFRIARGSIRLRFASVEMDEAVSPAFEHLEIEPAARPQLDVSIWDAARSGTMAPPEPSGVSDEDGPGVSYYHATADDRVRSIYEVGAKALSALDTQTLEGWYWAADALELPYWDRAAPIRHLIHWWLGSSGIQQVHGGAVGSDDGGLLLVGPGGSGKSTSTLACLDSKIKFAGDDYVAVSTEPSPWVHSIYNSGKLEPEHFERFPHLATPATETAILEKRYLDRYGHLPQLWERWLAEGRTGRLHRKVILYAHERFPASMSQGFPLKGIAFPRVTDEAKTRLVPLPRARALAALAPTSLIQFYPARPGALRLMAELVSSVPTFTLALGTDIPAIPDAIADALAAL